MKNENGIEKSAILSGQTLVNLLDLSSIESSSGIIVNHDNKTVEYVLNQNQIVVKLKNLKANTKYAILYDVYTDTTSTNSPIRINDTGDNYNNNVYSKLNTKTFTTNDDVSNVNIIFYNIPIQNIGFKCSFPIILEYQDGMENWDIPYFEGMQSVKNSQTLVNIIDYDNISLENATDNGDGTYTLKHAQDVNTSYVIPKTTKKNLFKPNTKYLLAVNIIENNTGTVLGLSGIKSPFTVTDNSLKYFKDKLGWQFKTLTTNSDIGVDVAGTPISNYIYFGIWKDGGDLSTSIKFKFMLIEYQEGMENWDIPYFEGMQSVKLPVLTTTGKNLFDKTKILENSALEGTSDTVLAGWIGYYVSDYIPVKKNEPIFIPATGSARKIYCDKNKEYVHQISHSDTYFTPEFDGFIRLTFINVDLNTYQLEYNTQATSYEPYKSNILTVNEEVELRGVGDVQDELNLLTGEYVQRIGEVVLDGSSNVIYELNSGAFYVQVKTLAKLNDYSFSIISDKGRVLKDNTYVRSYDSDDLVISGYKDSGNSHPNDNWIYFVKKGITSVSDMKAWLTQNPITVQYELSVESIKTVDLTIQDQDNQPQERMKLFPNGHINTSSSTFLPILELKGITHNNKLNMTTTNGTNNTQLATLNNLALDGIICRDGTVVRDSYDVESGLYTKRVFRFTIDEEFVERYRSKWRFTNSTTMTVAYITTTYPKCVDANHGITNLLPFMYKTTTRACCVTTNTSNLYITLSKEEVSSYDVDGILEWIKRNGNIEVAYQMATPQIIHMQPNMQPYVSTRPCQGSIESQGNILESSYLDYTSEQSIISPKPLGDGDVLRWEQGSQCYVYENDKEYIPLTDYNQPMGTVLDLEEEDGEQYVENLDGGDIIVDVPFKEKAVYERHLTPYEDKVIYPTQDKLDPTGKIEVDYICGETWQNPNDLSDIRHVGTLREDGQYDVTIRRSGDDEIRLLEGTTHIGLDGDGLNPSEFELTFFNSGGVEVGKYGDTIHTLEDCVLDSKLETGTVYGQTLNNLHQKQKYTQYIHDAYKSNCTITKEVNNVTVTVNKDFTNSSEIGSFVLFAGDVTQELKPSTKYLIVGDIGNMTHASIRTGDSKVIACNDTTIIDSRYAIITTKDSWSETDETNKLRILFTLNTQPQNKTYSVKNVMMFEYQDGMENWNIPYFEGVGSTIVNGFTTVGKNLLDSELFIPAHNANIDLTMDEEGWIEANCKAPQTTFFYHVDLTKLPKGEYKVVAEYYEGFDGHCVCQLRRYDGKNDYYGIGIKIDTEIYYQVGLYMQTAQDVPTRRVKLRPMLVPYSETDLTYEPYHSVQHTLPTPITLNKVGDVCDTYDVVSGVQTINTVITTITGSSHEFIDNGNQNEYRSYIIRLKESEYITRASRTYVQNDDMHIYTGVDSQTNIYVNMYKKDGHNDTYAHYRQLLIDYLNNNPLTIMEEAYTPIKAKHTLIPSTVETMQEPTFILPQPLRSVPNGICDRLYWDENKGHYCIEKRVGIEVFDGVNNFNLDVNDGNVRNRFGLPLNNILYINNATLFYYTNSNIFPQLTYNEEYDGKQGLALYYNGMVYFRYSSSITNAQFKQILSDNPVYIYYSINKTEIIDLPHLNKKLTLPTQPNTLPIGYKVEYPKANPQLGLTIPYKQLNYPSRPQNIDFKMDIADYVLTWDDVKEARQYNIILNDRTIATVKEPQWNSGEEMYGYIMVEAQNELADNLSEELYIKTVPNAPAQLTVAHNPMTDYYDFEISFIKTSAIAEYYTVQYRIDDGDWVYKTIQSDEIDPNSKVLWRFSIYEINEQIEVWATATNEIGTNDILPSAIYYMSPTPQWTYRINSKELFVRWMDDSPYDTQYKLRYQYKSDGIYRYAYFEGDKQEIGKLYEALIPLADDEEVSIALCVISEKENLYTKPIKASKELDPNIKPPKNFNYHWLARGLIEFYWEDNYDVDVEYEAIVEHRLTSGNNEWITDTRIFSATDTEGTGTVYRLSYQMEDLEEIRVKVRMKWAMNETEWSESLTTVFIPVEGNPPQWIRRTQTQEGLLVEWEAQEYVDSYHVYVMSNGEELQHLETMDNFIYVDLDYSNPIDIEIYEATRFSGGIQSDPSDKMSFRPTMDKHQLIHDVVTPDTLTYEIEVDTVQRGIKERQVIHDINTTPKVTDKQPMDVSISSPFTLSFHPLQLDVHQSGSKYYGNTELHIKTLDVKSRDAIEVLTFERITDQYGVDFTVYTPSASKYPITLEVNRVRIVCFGDSLTSGHPGFWAETGTGDPQHCYEYWLDRRLKGQYEILNKGYGSDTTDRMLARFDRDVLSYSPQYCIIQGGTNDLYWAMAESMGDQEALDMKLDVMKANIMEMVKRCWDNNIVPIVGNLIPRTGATGIYKTALYDFNAWIISWCTGQAAEGRNIFYVDLFNAGKEAVPPTPIEDPTNPGAMNPIYDGDALFDEFGNIIKQGRGIHLNKEGYRIWAEAIPLSIFKTYDSGLRMYKDLHCTDEDNYDDSDKQNPFYTISIDNVRRSKTKTVVRYVKNIGKTQVLFAMYASDEYNMSIEFVGSDGEKGAYANGLLAPNMIAKVTMEINLDNKDSKASFNLHLAAREYNQN